MYSIIFLLALFGAIAFIAVVVMALKSRGDLSPWDIGSAMVPCTLWFLLVTFGALPKSMSNLLEVFALLPITACFFAVRLKVAKVRPSVIFGICTMAALLLYVFVPVLPE